MGEELELTGAHVSHYCKMKAEGMPTVVTGSETWMRVNSVQQNHTMLGIQVSDHVMSQVEVCMTT